MGLKISTIVDEKVWQDFKALSEETRLSLSALLDEALKDYTRKKRLRPEFFSHLKDSLAENERLGKLLAK